MNKETLLKYAALLSICIFVCSFFQTAFSGKEKTVQTSFLNPSFTEQLSSVYISEGADQIEFFKENGLWKGKIGAIVFPLIQVQVENLVQELSKIRRTSEISARKTEQKEECVLAYTLNDGKSTVIYFGAGDFSRTQRFYWTDKSEKVFRTLDTFSPLLSADAGIWYDPYLVPRNLTSSEENKGIQSAVFFENGKQYSIRLSDSNAAKEKIEKLEELRHGRLYAGSTEGLVKVARLSCVLDDGKIVSIDIFSDPEDSESSFVIRYVQEGLNYTSQISLWTLNTLRGLFY